jgi:hypothetical protein
VGQKLALRHASAVQVTAFGCFTGTVANLLMPSEQTLLALPCRRGAAAPRIS